MERERGPDGQIIIRGFAKDAGAGHYQPPESADIKHSRRTLPYVPGVLLLAVALAVGAIALWISTSDDGGDLTDDEWAALAETRYAGEVQQPYDPRRRSSAAGSRATDRVSIDVISEPAGAPVFIDFDSVGVTPLRNYWLAEGVYVISISMDEGERADTVLVLDGASDRSFYYAAGWRSEDDAWYADEGGDMGPIVVRGLGDRTGRAEAYENADRPHAGTAQERAGAVPASQHRSISSSLGEMETEERSDQESRASGELAITSDPAGASIEIDGQHRGSTPIHVRDVAPGEHEVRIRMDGYFVLHTTIDVAPAETAIHSYALKELGETVASEAESDTMTEATRPNARIGW